MPKGLKYLAENTVTIFTLSTTCIVELTKFDFALSKKAII